MDAARDLLKAARTADELRAAQSVLLPLELGLSIAQTAKVIGRSVGATSTMRNRFFEPAARMLATSASEQKLKRPAKVNADVERTQKILSEVLEQAERSGVVAVAEIKLTLEDRLGKPLALSSVYRMLTRQGWRKPKT